ncbi:hypothetical protein [Desulfovibrio cuneatus]|uniref:hypothetical protein n=1 Tax=Desulfovibrio cuneatus TaxID=159728 RepID=UPI00041AE82E|nr:hypothetical protein [Desulfovibrio cuneatus]
MQITIDGIQTSAIAAGKEYLRLPSFWLESIRRCPLTRGGLTLPDPTGEEIQRISKGNAVTVVMGYRGEAPGCWQAEVTWVRPGTQHQVELGLVAADAAFARKRFTEAWMHETPEAILRRVLSAAGIVPGTINAPGCTLPRFAVSNENVWQIAEKLELTCQQAFAIDTSRWALFMDSTGTAHWGDMDAPDQTSVPGVVTGGNLIVHSPATDAAALGQVETFLLPHMRHSHQFRLQDMYRGVSGLYRAQRVRHEVTGHKARTFLWYGTEHGRY